jgi:hypothetical protein
VKQNKLIALGGKKSKASDLTSNAETAVDTSMNIVYRKVLIKLIAPNTRQVIGRISEKTFSVEESPQTLLNQEAEKFKRLVTLMGTQLITQNFSDLGLPLKMSNQRLTG